MRITPFVLILIGFLLGLVIGFSCGATTGVERVEVVTQKLLVSETALQEMKRESEASRRSMESLRAARAMVDGYWEPVVTLAEALVSLAPAVGVDRAITRQEELADLIRAQSRLLRLADTMRGSPAGAPPEVFANLRTAQERLIQEFEKGGLSPSLQASLDETKQGILQAHGRFNRAVRGYNEQLRAAKLTWGFAPQLEIE